jgi:hypothetical protein
VTSIASDGEKSPVKQFTTPGPGGRVVFGRASTNTHFFYAMSVDLESRSGFASFCATSQYVRLLRATDFVANSAWIGFVIALWTKRLWETRCAGPLIVRRS